jgi:5,10-methylenetetrahydrofolate reductase
MSNLKESLKQGKFTITGEVGPPKGVDLKHCWEHEVSYIKDRVVAINVTDNQSSVMRISSKIRNMLALTGDHNTAGDHPESIPVYDLDSVSLLVAMSALKNGKDLAGQELEGAPEDIFPGATVTPGLDPLGMQLIKMERKIEAGAQFFQTQAIYDAKVFENFMNKGSKFKVPVLCGIVIIKSAGMANYMNNFVPGVHVPDEMIKPLKEASKEDRPKVSIELMAKFIEEVKPMCQGLHIMAMGWERYVPEMLDMCSL